MRKAKVKATGEIIEVKEWRGASDVIYSTPDMNMFYASNELDFLPEESPESTTMVGYVARHANPHWLSVFNRKPDRLSDMWSAFDSNVIGLDPTLFPSVTWESEPLKVRITITPIEDE